MQWTRVHDLPDFVYFNHSIHVNKGVGCATCHGPVDKMPLMYQESNADDVLVPRLPPGSGAATSGRATRSSTWPGSRRQTIRELGERLVAEYKIGTVPAADELLDLPQVVRRSAGPTIYMDFSADSITSRGAEGRFYWRSLGELADTTGVPRVPAPRIPRAGLRVERPEGPPSIPETDERVAGARRASAPAPSSRPEAIVPYVRQPEDIVPGRPLFFASAIPLAGVRSAGAGRKPYGASDQDRRQSGSSGKPWRHGRHHTGGGSGSVRPRSRSDDRPSGRSAAWGTFLSAMQSALRRQKATQGAGIRFLTEPITSPSLAELMATVLQDFPQGPLASVRSHVALGRGGARRTPNPIYQFDKADVVARRSTRTSCAADRARFATPAISPIDAGSPTTARSMNRLYAVESTPTLTGAKADHRLPLRASEVEPFARALAGAAGVTASGAAEAGRAWTADEQKWIAAVAKDLQRASRPLGRCRRRISAGRRSRARAGDERSARRRRDYGEVRRRGRRPGRPIRPPRSPSSPRAMDAGQVQVLVMIGESTRCSRRLSNLQFAEKLGEGRSRGLSRPATATRPPTCATGTSPATHPLESWGDPRAFDGTVTIMQPLDRAALRGPLGARAHLRASRRNPAAAPAIRQGVLDARVRRQWRVDDRRLRRARRSRTRMRSGAAPSTMASSPVPR